MSRRGAALCASSVAAALASCYLLSKWGWIACLFRRFTGLPCPLCGGTRAMNALLHGEFLTALALNPLVAVSAVVLLPCAIVLVVRPDIVSSRSIHCGWIVLGAVTINWIYLIARMA